MARPNISTGDPISSSFDFRTSRSNGQRTSSGGESSSKSCSRGNKVSTIRICIRPLSFYLALLQPTNVVRNDQDLNQSCTFLCHNGNQYFSSHQPKYLPRGSRVKRFLFWKKSKPFPTIICSKRQAVKIGMLNLHCIGFCKPFCKPIHSSYDRPSRLSAQLGFLTPSIIEATSKKYLRWSVDVQSSKNRSLEKNKLKKDDHFSNLGSHHAQK